MNIDIIYLILSSSSNPRSQNKSCKWFPKTNSEMEGLQGLVNTTIELHDLVWVRFSLKPKAQTIHTKFQDLTILTLFITIITDIWCSQQKVSKWTHRKENNIESRKIAHFFKEKLIIFFLLFIQELFNQFFYFSIK